jgi:hypothetical protein
MTTGTVASISSVTTVTSCNFTTWNDIAQILKYDQADIELVVKQCHNLCLVVNGAGNPDLAGVGV